MDAGDLIDSKVMATLCYYRQDLPVLIITNRLHQLSWEQECIKWIPILSSIIGGDLSDSASVATSTAANTSTTSATATAVTSASTSAKAAANNWPSMIKVVSREDVSLNLLGDLKCKIIVLDGCQNLNQKVGD